MSGSTAICPATSLEQLFSFLPFPRQGDDVTGVKEASDTDSTSFFSKYSKTSLKQHLDWVKERLPKKETNTEDTMLQKSTFPISDIWFKIGSQTEKTKIDLSISKFKIKINKDLYEFCTENFLVPLLAEYLQILSDCFPESSLNSVEIEQDPEIDDQWLSFNLDLRCGADQFMRYYTKYLSKVSIQIPLPARNKMRLSYNMV